MGKWKTIFQMTGLSLMMFRRDVFGMPVYEIGVVAAGGGRGAHPLVHGQLPAGRLAPAAA